MRMRRMTRATIAVIGLALVVVVAFWVLGHSGKAELTVPPLGAASAQSLPDGRPVFVVRHSDNTITVVDAFATHVPSGVYKLVAWCPRQRLFTDLIHGATYDEWGSKVGGPAPFGMTVDEWHQNANGIDVTGSLGTASATSDRRGPFEWATCHFVMHQFDAAQALDPAEALKRPERQWVLVEGGLDTERGRLCATYPVCSEFAPIRGIKSYPGDSSWATFLSGDRFWLAWNSGDALEHLTIVPPLNP
jgi:hypothetical protein